MENLNIQKRYLGETELNDDFDLEMIIKPLINKDYSTIVFRLVHKSIFKNTRVFQFQTDTTQCISSKNE